MHQLRLASVVVVILGCLLQTESRAADKYTDENRPYEFGFNIERDGEKEQHRHEKKGEDGLIEGEFGFITADGVYHVTVYATDENGNFKILSMKNIRVKPYPGTAERKGKAPVIPASGKKPITEGPKGISLEQPARSCSHCSIPTTKAPEITDLAVVSRDDPAYNQPQYPDQHQYPKQPNYPEQPRHPEQPQYPELPQHPEQPQYPDQPQYPEQPLHPEQPQYPDQPQYPEQPLHPEQPQYPEQPQHPAQPQHPEQPQYPQDHYPEQPQNQHPQDPASQYPEQSLTSGERNPKQYDPSNYPLGQDANKPTLISAQMHFIDRNTDINALAPGEQPGLPNGLDKGDMQLLLYTFNYTVGFHGHYEEGYTNGYKKGYYFVTGRNGVRTRVDYEADDKGFRPKITQELLELISEEVPKEETEKDAKYGLKGYEFKWLYYPADSRRR